MADITERDKNNLWAETAVRQEALTAGKFTAEARTRKYTRQ